ncbi:MAG: hypothetical protein ACI361_03690 [Atopobiaceae bacterium]
MQGFDLEDMAEDLYSAQAAAGTLGRMAQNGLDLVEDAQERTRQLYARDEAYSEHLGQTWPPDLEGMACRGHIAAAFLEALGDLGDREAATIYRTSWPEALQEMASRGPSQKYV